MKSTRSPRYRRFLTRLKAARKEAGLTQVQVAKRLRQSQAFVSKSESGDRRVDAIELGAFSRLYDKPLDFFVE